MIILTSGNFRFRPAKKCLLPELFSARTLMRGVVFSIVDTEAHFALFLSDQYNETRPGTFRLAYYAFFEHFNNLSLRFLAVRKRNAVTRRECCLIEVLLPMLILCVKKKFKQQTL